MVARKWRTQQKARNRVPIVTCNPWKPVVTKKIDPYTLSRHENLTPYLYSYAWQKRKTIPKTIVKNKYQENPSTLFLIIRAWAIVIVTPEVKSNSVFTRGNPHTSSSCVPKGGQTLPRVILGTRLK